MFGHRQRTRVNRIRQFMNPATNMALLGGGAVVAFQRMPVHGKLRSILGDLGIRNISADVIFNSMVGDGKCEAMLEAIKVETGPPL